MAYLFFIFKSSHAFLLPSPVDDYPNLASLPTSVNRFLKKSPEVARSSCNNPDDNTQTERISVRITLRPTKHNNHMNSPRNIPVRISPRRIHYGRGISLGQNGCNLVSKKISKNVPPSTVKVPKLMLTNVRSLAPKMDEISYFMLHNHVD